MSLTPVIISDMATLNYIKILQLDKFAEKHKDSENVDVFLMRIREEREGLKNDVDLSDEIVRFYAQCALDDAKKKCPSLTVGLKSARDKFERLGLEVLVEQNLHVSFTIDNKNYDLFVWDEEDDDTNVRLLTCCVPIIDMEDESIDFMQYKLAILQNAVAFGKLRINETGRSIDYYFVHVYCGKIPDSILTVIHREIVGVIKTVHANQGLDAEE